MELGGLGNGGAGPGLGDGGAGPGPARRRADLFRESGDGGSLLRLEDGGAGQSSEMAKLAGARDGNWPGLGDGEAGKGSETVELARGSETVSRPELRDGETGQSSCFCLFIGVFWRVNCLWIGNSGAGKGSETAGWPGARRRRRLFRGSETAELARARTWETAELFWGLEPRRSWLGLGDGGTSQC